MTSLIITIILVFVFFFVVVRIHYYIKNRVKSKKPNPWKGKANPYVYTNKDKKDDLKVKYPLFIPFYEWKGFWNGLHPNNRLFYMTKGKQGECPKNFKNPFN